MGSEQENSDELRVDLNARAVFLGEQQLDASLSKNEFSLIAAMYERAGEVCSREDLSHAIWGAVGVEGDESPASDEHMLHSLVYRLRTKLRAAGLDLNTYLENIAGVGYRLHTSGDFGGARPTPKLEALHNEPQKPWRRRTAIVFLTTGFAAILFSLVFIALDGSDDSAVSGGESPEITADGSPSETPDGPDAQVCGSELTHPALGSVLTGSTVTFEWTPGCNMIKHDLWVGCSPRSVEFFNADDGYQLEATVSDLPVDGGPVFVQLVSSDGTEEGTFIEKYEFETMSQGNETVVYLSGDTDWVDTGVDVGPDDSILIQACGQIAVNTETYPAFEPIGDGDCPGAWRFGFPAPSLPCWSLMGRIDGGIPFAAGPWLQANPGQLQGRLYLGINDDDVSDNSGGFRVTLTVSRSEG